MRSSGVRCGLFAIALGQAGRIKCGTEASGGFRKIAITNCICESCCGLALQTVGGGDRVHYSTDAIRFV
jgi:polygalacturonase